MTGRSFRFAHLADAHVGAWARNPPIRAALRESVVRAIEGAHAEGAEFLLISGDLFHTPVPEPAEAAPVARALRRYVEDGRRVYTIYGSHDYVAHRTSWLDVLAETGIFLRAAPEAVREEGTRWSLPFLTDGPTGTRIAGVSGRSHGLDRSYFASLDAEAFRAAPGFKVFQFHAAIREYLPPHLRDHIQGISRTDLPGGVDYYAGGHIHYTYEGEGPDGGKLVNPGAVFGTSATDLEHALRGGMKQGFVLVDVVDGSIGSVTFVETAPKDRLRVVDIDVSGQSVDEARATVRSRVEAASVPGALLFPWLSGQLSEGSVTALGITEASTTAAERGAGGIHWEVDGLEPGDRSPAGPEPIGELEEATLRLLSAPGSGAPERLQGEEGLRRLHELLKRLGTPQAEGEATADYEKARLDEGLRILEGESSATEPRNDAD